MYINNILKSLIVFFVLFAVAVIATPNEIHFTEIPKKNLSAKLKGIAFATIRTSIIKKYTFSEIKDIRYIPCPSDFPELPGEFPCNLLSWNDSTLNIETQTNVNDAENLEIESPLEDLSGGRVNINISNAKSPNIGGLVAKLGEDEDHLQLFYHKNDYISHYKFQSQVVVFQWKEIENVNTLIGVMILKLDQDSFPISAKELIFKK